MRKKEVRRDVRGNKLTMFKVDCETPLKGINFLYRSLP